MEKTPLEQFKQDITDRVSQYPDNQPLQSASQEFLIRLVLERPITFIILPGSECP